MECGDDRFALFTGPGGDLFHSVGEDEFAIGESALNFGVVGDFAFHFDEVFFCFSDHFPDIGLSAGFLGLRLFDEVEDRVFGIDLDAAGGEIPQGSSAGECSTDFDDVVMKLIEVFAEVGGFVFELFVAGHAFVIDLPHGSAEVHIGVGHAHGGLPALFGICVEIEPLFVAHFDDLAGGFAVGFGGVDAIKILVRNEDARQEGGDHCLF